MHLEQAEVAYRQSLDINTSLANLPGQASSLNMLGNLYNDKLNKPQQALDFYQQALVIYRQLQDNKSMGVAHNNIAATLLGMQHFAEAKKYTEQALQYNLPLGHVAQPWKSYDILCQIERGLNQPALANTAWQNARDCYLAYRLQGGYPQTQGGKLADEVYQLVVDKQIDQAVELLNQIIDNEQNPDWYKLLAQVLLQITTGQRDKTRADNDELTYSSAAEILYLIERLASPS